MFAQGLVAKVKKLGGFLVNNPFEVSIAKTHTPL
jgi:hypothetical protein